jgi:two-component system, chemotaxis family, protein-glutamate methylesterase/glutaminase
VPPHPLVGSIRRDLIVIGGSAGSLDTMRAIARAFPAGFPGTLFIVTHIGQSRSVLPDLLRRAGSLSSSHPRDEEPIRKGHIYVAPPDRHLLFQNDRVCLSRGPREHFTRPAIDPLFRSAAHAHGPRVIGVVLSGGGSDGAMGLAAVGQAGGLTIVEDPSEAIFPDMPQVAVSMIEPDFVVHAAGIPELLVRLSAEAVPTETAKASEGAHPVMDELERPLTFSCPDCGGALRPIPETGLQQFGCHVGHRFGAMEILEAQSSGVEKNIYVALRMLNEQAEFARRMIESARDSPLDNGLVFWERLQVQAEEQAETLQHFLDQRPAPRVEAEAADD